MKKGSKPVTQEEIARLLGVEDRSIRNYHKVDPPIPTARRGKAVLYPDSQCVQWMIERRIAEVESKQGPSELDMAKQRKEIASARKMELEVAEMEGNLMPVETHEARLAERCEELAGRVKGLNRFVLEIRSAPTDEEADVIADRMEDELLKALQGVSDEIPEPEEPNGDGGSAIAA